MTATQDHFYLRVRDEGYSARVKIMVYHNKYWDYCVANFIDWKYGMPFLGNGGSFYFKNPEDATLFILMFKAELNQ